MAITNLLLLVLIAAVVSEAKYRGPTTDEGISLIKQSEGFKADFYLDQARIRTIGYGHACHVWDCNVPLNGKYSVPLSLSTAEDLLKDDLKSPGRYEDCVNNYVTYSGLNEHQFSALVSFAFNVGCHSLRTSTLLTKLNSGDVYGASEEFSKWILSRGRVLQGLVRRRAAEKKLFCEGGTCVSNTCIGVTTEDRVAVKRFPSTTAPTFGHYPDEGSRITIVDRETRFESSVNGNPYWFKLSYGSDYYYVPAYYVNILADNGDYWCNGTNINIPGQDLSVGSTVYQSEAGNLGSDVNCHTAPTTTSPITTSTSISVSNGAEWRVEWCRQD